MKFKNVWLLKAAFPLILAGALLGFSSCASTSEAKGEEPQAYDIEELYISHGSHGENEIYGVLYRPKAAEEGQVPLVVISHGYNDSSWRSLKYAAAFADAGFAAFCFDFCGGSAESKSTGSTQEMSIFTEQADLEAVIAKMKELPFVDSENIFLVGASQGGAVSALVAAANPQDVRGMALIYPAFVIPDDARKDFASIDDVPEAYDFMGMTIGKAYYEGLFDYDIFGAIAPYAGNVLIIHGDADALVPISYSQQALEVYGSAELKVMEGAGHGFSDEQAQQAIEWILEYLQQETGEQ